MFICFFFTLTSAFDSRPWFFCAHSSKLFACKPFRPWVGGESGWRESGWVGGWGRCGKGGVGWGGGGVRSTWPIDANSRSAQQTSPHWPFATNSQRASISHTHAHAHSRELHPLCVRRLARTRALARPTYNIYARLALTSNRCHFFVFTRARNKRGEKRPCALMTQICEGWLLNAPAIPLYGINPSRAIYFAQVMAQKMLWTRILEIPQ